MNALNIEDIADVARTLFIGTDKVRILDLCDFYGDVHTMLVAGWLEMTIPDKPTSSRQQYRLTTTGKALLEALEQPQ